MNPWALVSLCSVFVLLSLCVFVYRRRPPKPLWPTLFLALLFPLIFNLGNFLLYLTDDPYWSWVFLAITYSGMIFVSPINFILVHRFAEALGKSFRWGRSKWLWAPIPIAFMAWLAMITNPWHELFLIPRVNQRSDFQILWLAHTIFAYVLAISTLSMYFILFSRVRSTQLRTRVLVMAASIFALAGNALFFIPALRVPFDPTTLGFALAGILYLLSIYPTRAYAIRPFVLTSIFRRQSVGLVLTDAEGHISFWNDAAEDALGESLNRIDEPFLRWLARHLDPLEAFDDKAFYERILGQFQLSPTSASTTQVLRLKYVPDRWIRLVVHPITDSQGKRLDSLSFQIEDVSRAHLDELERKQIQTELESHQKQEGLAVLAGGIAHDFNNILMAIQGNVELSLSDQTLSTSLRKRLEVMGDATQRGSRLTQQLLAYAGKSTPQSTRLELQSLVGGITDLLGTITKSRGLYLRTSVDPDVTVSADQGQLEQVIMNLTLNAVEASANGGSIFLSAGSCDQSGTPIPQNTTAKPAFAFISVRDEGTGMDKETRSRIFDPFFSTKKEGRGLGLAAVRGIVHSHGGRLSVESRQGEGTEFRIVLPLHEGMVGPEEEGAVVLARRSLSVLVVDDEPTVGNVCCEMLRAAGCDTLFADSGARAIAMFEEQGSTIELAVLDIAMPEIDGMSVFEKLRDLKPRLPVVFVSGHLSNILPPQIADSTGVRFLGKPYGAQQLIRVVNSAVLGGEVIGSEQIFLSN